MNENVYVLYIYTLRIFVNHLSFTMGLKIYLVKLTTNEQSYVFTRYFLHIANTGARVAPPAGQYTALN